MGWKVLTINGALKEEVSTVPIPDPLTVAHGGTGDTTLTGVVLGNGTSAFSAVSIPSDSTKFLDGSATPVYDTVKDSDLSTSDITTNDVSNTKHGFAPKNPNDATKFLNGVGTYTVPANGSWDVEVTKGSDQSVGPSNSTFQVDSALISAILANEIWYFELLIIYDGEGTAEDYKGRVSVSAGLMTGWVDETGDFGTGGVAINQVTSQISAAAQSGSLAAGTSAGAHTITHFLILHGMVKFDTNGNFQYEFAQNTSTAAVTVTTKAGSRLRMKKLV